MRLFYRDGSEVTAEDLPRVQMGARGDSGYIVKRGPCSRCGGQGGADAWRYTGFTCYRCGGRNSMSFEVRDARVYVADKLAKLEAATEKKRQTKLAAARRKADKQRREFIAWAKSGGRDRGALIGRLLLTGKPQQDGFVHDLARKLRQHWTLSPAQLEAAVRVFNSMDERAKQDEASQHVGEIKERVEFEGIVEFETTRDGYYGLTHILKFRSTDGNLFVWFASGRQELGKGDRVGVRGTVKKHDEFRGAKQTNINRCKITKFETMSPEQAAQAEVIS